MEEKLYKVVGPGLQSCQGGVFDWRSYTTSGDWTPPIDDPLICCRGYHLTTDPMQWAGVGMQVFEAEGRGCGGRQDDKRVFASVRLVRAVPDIIPSWWRAVEAFVAELPTLPWLWPQGEPDPKWRAFDTWDATWDAARAATRAAARAATWDAARAAARAATWDAARAATRAAARDAARDAAMAATWDAAMAATWDAARAAARAATWDAARAATRAAAMAATWDAAMAAALWASVLVCKGLPLAQQHIDLARARMDVWRRGYICVGDVDGVLYVARRLW